MNNRRDFIKQTIFSSAGILLTMNNLSANSDIVTDDGDLGVLKLSRITDTYSIYEAKLLKVGNYKRSDGVISITLNDLMEYYCNLSNTNGTRSICSFEPLRSVFDNQYNAEHYILTMSDVSYISCEIKVSNYIADLLDVNNLFLLPSLNIKNKSIEAITLSKTRSFGYYV